MLRVCAVALVLVVTGACLGPIRSTMPVPAEDRDSAVRGNTRFALDLYAQFRQREGNLFFSPLSIYEALAMTSAGARGETLAEMSRTLHLPDQERLHPAMNNLGLHLRTRHRRHADLMLANALWGQAGKRFAPDFVALLRDHYGAEMGQVDFAGPAARKTINAWAAEQTRGRIKELLAAGAINGATRLVLTNAVYFKADWASQFQKRQTRPDAFTMPDGSTVKAPLMRQQATAGYHATEDVQILEMPYVGKTLGMVVLLPAKGSNLAALEEKLTKDNLAAWLGALEEKKVSVTFPRFRLRTGLDLNGELANMGMPSAFDRRADFSGMDGGREKLFLSKVVHQAFVDVNEEGTEAAAATAVVVSLSRGEAVPEFRADRPFVFLIRDRDSGCVLFLGRVTNPL